MSHTLSVYAGVLFGGFAVTYFWRALAVVLVSHLHPEGAVLTWVRCIATSLVAALVMRLTFVPAGVLAETSLSSRVLALLMGVVVYFAARRRVEAGVAASVITIALVESLYA